MLYVAVLLHSRSNFFCMMTCVFLLLFYEYIKYQHQHVFIYLFGCCSGFWGFQHDTAIPPSTLQWPKDVLYVNVFCKYDVLYLGACAWNVLLGCAWHVFWRFLLLHAMLASRTAYVGAQISVFCRGSAHGLLCFWFRFSILFLRSHIHINV